MNRRIRALLSRWTRRPARRTLALSADDEAWVSRVRGARLTYLSDQKIRSLVDTCRRIEREEVPGVFIEAGCALGGSLILIAKMKSQQRLLLGHDVFGMIPPPTVDDPPEVHERYRTIAAGASEGIDGDRDYGYEQDLYEIVQRNLRRFEVDLQRDRVQLVRGLVQDTLHVDQPVAFAHIDVDWYEPVKTCLERIAPRLSPGGAIILDDYHDWGGCRQAVDEFLQARWGEFHSDDSARSLKLVRLR